MPSKNVTTNGFNLLPASDSPSLTLIAPTPSQKLLQFTHNGESWRGPLTQERYIEREAHLANQDFTRDGGITYWILVDGSLPSEQQVALSGCETLRKRAFVSSKSGAVEEVIAHGVGSVYCPSEYRGRGYAGRMMIELGKRLGDGWQGRSASQQANGSNGANGHHHVKDEKSVLFSILYSDIGKTFYARRGWKAYPSKHLSLSAISSSSLGAQGLKSLSQAIPLSVKDIPALCLIDEEQLRKERAVHTNDDSHKPRVALIPDAPTISWHHAREDFLAQEIFGRTPTVKGAIVTVGVTPGTTRRIWCYFNRSYDHADTTNPQGNTLYILRICIEDVPNNDSSGNTPDIFEGLSALMQLARQEAALWNCATVQVWNPSETLEMAAGLLGDGEFEVVDREAESIASLFWFGQGGKEDKVEWMANEKFGWC